MQSDGGLSKPCKQQLSNCHTKFISIEYDAEESEHIAICKGNSSVSTADSSGISDCGSFHTVPNNSATASVSVSQLNLGTQHVNEYPNEGNKASCLISEEIPSNYPSNKDEIGGTKNLYLVCWTSKEDKTALKKIPLHRSIIYNTISEKGSCLCIASTIGAFEFLCSEEFPVSSWNNVLASYGCKIVTFWDIYKVVRTIGAGSFSSVFVALNSITQELTIVKAVNKSKVRESSVYDEIEILRKVDHPYIVKLKSSFEAESKVFLVMEYLKGGEVFSWIAKNGCYSEVQARGAIRRILLALQCLHSHGIVHRDIKSENLMLEEENRPDSTKIIDFGLACSIKSPSLRMRCGSPGYVAPEILLDKPYSTKVDMFSVGVTLYTMLAGYPPFSGRNVKETLKKNIRATLSFRESRWRVLPSAVKDLVAWMCCGEPYKRCGALQALAHTWFEGIPNVTILNKQFITKEAKNKNEQTVKTLETKANQNSAIQDIGESRRKKSAHATNSRHSSKLGKARSWTWHGAIA